MAAAFAAPIGYLVARNLASPGDLLDVVASDATLGPLRRTLAISVSVAAASAVIGTLLAWLTTRTDVPWARVWRAVLPLPLVIPSYVGASALLAAFAPGGLVGAGLDRLGLGQAPRIEGFWGAFIVLTLLTYPYVYLPVAARFSALPSSLEESSRLLGAGSWATFARVVLPQARPAIWAGALLVGLYTVSDFGAVQLMRFDTLTRAIYSSRLLPASLALSLVLGTVALMVAASERAMARRRQVTPGRSDRPLVRLALGRARLPALATVGAVATLGLVAPVVVLGWWAFRGLASGRENSAALAADLANLVSPAAHTAGLSLTTAVVALAVVTPVAFLTTRFRSRAGETAHALVVGGLALPGLVVALALGFWALQAPVWLGLYQSLPLLIVAYVVHFGAQGLRVAEVAVAGVSSRLGEAASVLGASPTRRLASVELPLMLPGLAAGAGLVLLSTMKELPATLLLSPTGYSTLATKIWNAAEDGFLAEMGLASLVLLSISGLLTWALVLRRGQNL
ncbi:MAG: ABC transporter permease [Acidimicrobiales bacterium]